MECDNCGYDIKIGEKVKVIHGDVMCPNCGQYSGLTVPFPK